MEYQAVTESHGSFSIGPFDSEREALAWAKERYGPTTSVIPVRTITSTVSAIDPLWLGLGILAFLILRGSPKR